MKQFLSHFLNTIKYFFKWLILAIILGGIGGLIGGGFGKLIELATGVREGRTWVVAFLPLIGLLIVFLYHITKEKENRGTDMVLNSIAENNTVTMWTGPLIFVSTILSHLGGASVGREGAALQLGGWLGARSAEIFRFNDKDRHIAIMCGMAAAFSALFGTPVAAAVFCIEVVTVGVFQYEAFLPCIFAAYISDFIAGEVFGMWGDNWKIAYVPEADAKMLGLSVLLGLCCAIVSILVVVVLHQSKKWTAKLIPNDYLRVVILGIVFAAIILIFHAEKYTGSGISLIDSAMEGNVDYAAFAVKLLLTAIALSAGFRGGEIVPTLSIGATFGAGFGAIMGFPVSMSAACGMIAVFAGATNCPIAAILIAMEMFHGEGLPFFAITVAISFILSQHFSLYTAQRFNFDIKKAS